MKSHLLLQCLMAATISCSMSAVDAFVAPKTKSRISSKLDVLKDPNEQVKEKTASKETTRESKSPGPPKPPNNKKTPWGLPLDLMWARTLDTAEDAVIHARRMPYEMGWYKPNDGDDGERETIVVLGSGWAAHALLKCADNFKLRVIVVSPTNHFVFTPMLASASVGTVEYRSMTEAIRASNPMIDDYLEGKAIDVDVKKKTITVQLESLLQGSKERTPPTVEVPYDKLVVAVGCKVADDLVPGSKEYCLRLKTIDDARLLRDSVGESFEYASRPDVSDKVLLTEQEENQRSQERRRRLTFAIVGGGPTGVELAGELSDFIKDITKPHVGAYPRLRDDVRVVLIHGGSELVPQFEPRLRKHALEALQKQGVEVILDTRVLEVKEGSIRYMNKDTKKEETLDTGLNVWAAGTGPVPFVTKLLEKLPDDAKGRGGKINVDKWMRCPTQDEDSFGSIFVLGDAAGLKGRNGELVPQTAQVAGQQGAYVARLLDRDYDLTQTPPKLKDEATWLKAWLQLRGLEAAPGFDFLNLGLLAYVGSGQALTEIQLGTFTWKTLTETQKYPPFLIVSLLTSGRVSYTQAMSPLLPMLVVFLFFCGGRSTWSNK